MFPEKIFPMIEAMCFMVANAIFLILSATVLSYITFVIYSLLLISRFKRDVQKYHKGSFKNWFFWLIKKKQK